MVQIAGEGVGSEARTEYLTHVPKKDENGEYITPFEAYTIKMVDLKKKIASTGDKPPMGGTLETFAQIGEKLMVKITKQIGCASVYKEEFFDLSGKKIVNPTDQLPTYPREIIIWSLHLISDWTRAGESNMFGIKFSVVEAPKDLGTVSLRSNYIPILRERIMESSSIGLFSTYVIRFEEIPNILFYYKNPLGSSEAIISFPIESWDIDQMGNFTSEEKTKEILSLYTESDEVERKIWRSIRKAQNEDDYIGITKEDFSSKLMPIFRLAQWEGDRYFLFPAHGYEWFTSAELCKPLVYIYDIFSRKNALSVGFPRGGNFTKLIPAFSESQTWNFHSNAQGKILVKNVSKPAEYLYYSARVPDYAYNTGGWQVYGRDMRAFFDEKLDYIGLNAWEKKDFMEYWTWEFYPDTLYFVSFKFDAAIDSYVTLSFSEKPIRQMRILLEAYPIEHRDDAFSWPHVATRFDTFLLKHFDRSGIFDVFEWGGTVQKEKYGIIKIH